MKIFSQFFGDEDPFGPFFGGGMHGMGGSGGNTMFFSSGGPGGMHAMNGELVFQ